MCVAMSEEMDTDSQNLNESPRTLRYQELLLQELPDDNVNAAFHMGQPPLKFDELHNRMCLLQQRGTVVENGIVGNWQVAEGDIKSWRSTFTLPGQKNKCETLKHLHPLIRDNRVVFLEESHLYFVDGKSVPTSVTTFLQRFHEKFDADEAISKMKNGKRWPQRLQEEFTHTNGQPWTDEEIKTKWSHLGEEASGRGTLMHWHIEQYFNGQSIGLPLSPEFQMFQLFEQKYLKPKGIHPLRTEIALFHCGLGIAGQADFIGVLPCGRLIIIDWKRTKKIVTENPFQQMRPPMEHLPDCNLTHYQLQLNMYKYILESEYDMEVGELCLCVLHPHQTNYKMIQVPRMDNEIHAIVKYAKDHYGCQSPLPGAWAPFIVNSKLRILF